MNPALSVIDSQPAQPVPAGLSAPTYGSAWIGSLMPSAARMLTGRTPPGTIAGTAGMAGRARSVIVVLADGLGLQQLKQRRGHAPFLCSLGAGQLRTGAPSTTATSLGSLGTGLPPGRTGLAGYSLVAPGHSAPFSLLAWDTEIAPEQWQPHPTVFEWLTAQEVRVTKVGRERFADSGLTRAALRGGSYVTAGRGEAADAAAQASRGRVPALTYLYWGDIDKAGHGYGWRSAQWGAAVEEFDAAMSALVRAVASDCVIAITADHGMIDYDPAVRWDLATCHDLADGVRVVAGEPRALHLYCDDVGAVTARWRATLAEHAWVLTKDEAVGAGLFGPAVSAQARAALGDVIVLMNGCATVVDSRSQKPGMLAMIGHHGSLTRAETHVPLWVIRDGRSVVPGATPVA